MEMGKKGFRDAFFQNLRVQIPYWLILFAFASIGIAIESPLFEPFMMLVMVYLGVGAWVVFHWKRCPSVQDPDRFDLRGAAKNLGLAAQWPLFLITGKFK